MKPFRALNSSRIVVSIDEVIDVCLGLRVLVVMVAFNGGFLDGMVHSLDLSVGPGVVWLGQPVFDAIFSACAVEHVPA